jgi:hypothetical protein
MTIDFQRVNWFAHIIPIECHPNNWLRMAHGVNLPMMVDPQHHNYDEASHVA